MEFLKNTYIYKLFLQKVSDSRSRRILAMGIASTFTKIINLGIQVLTVPILLNYLGKSQYGIFASVYSLTSMLHFTDLGLGLSLQNKIPELQNDIKQLKKTISSTFWFLLFFTFFLFSLVLLYYHFTDRVDLLHADIIYRKSILILISLLLLPIAFSITQKIRIANMEGFHNEYWLAAGNILGFFFMFWAVNERQTLPKILFSIQIGPCIMILVNFFYFFRFKKPELKPLISYFEFNETKNLLKYSSKMFLVQVCAILINSTDIMLINHFIGPKEAADYSIGFRLVTYISIPFGIIVGLLLPGLNDAYFKKDKKWINFIAIEIPKILLIISLITFFIFNLFCNKILELWLNNITLNSKLVFSFSLILLVYIWNYYISVFALSNIFFQKTYRYYIFSALFIFFLKFIFLKYFTNYFTDKIYYLNYLTFVILLFGYLYPIFFKIKKLTI